MTCDRQTSKSGDFYGFIKQSCRGGVYEDCIGFHGDQRRFERHCTGAYGDNIGAEDLHKPLLASNYMTLGASLDKGLLQGFSEHLAGSAERIMKTQFRHFF